MRIHTSAYFRSSLLPIFFLLPLFSSEFESLFLASPSPLLTFVLVDSLHSLSPHLFLAAILVPADAANTPEDALPQIDFHSRMTIGRTVSSLYLLRDLDDAEGAFFVFSDISVRADGLYRMRMCLFEIEEYVSSFLSLSSTDVYIAPMSALDCR